VEVPPGHKVVVFRPTPEPALGRAESGYWILNFGDGRDGEGALVAIEAFARTGAAAPVIWILDAAFLGALQDEERFIARVLAVRRESPKGMGHCAVFAGDVARWDSLMRAFKAAGLGVHYAHADGACFVEVHRPDGVVVGMPGPPLQ
jgi:hypothetical protein